MIEYTVEDFFSKQLEVESTRILLNEPTIFSTNVLKDYLCHLAKIELVKYLDYLKENPNIADVTSKDITQLSNIDDCTINMCQIMLDCDNKGLSLKEIATLLHADKNYKDNVVALSKYGENQVKTAAQLGLVINFNDLWFLSAIGYIFPDEPKAIQNKYIAISILRDPFYSKVILSLIKHDTNLKDFMNILSESTQKRRFTICNRVLSFFKEQCEIEEVKIHNLTSK